MFPFLLGFFLRLAGIAPRNPISEEFRKDVLKHLPAMRSLNLDAGADYLHDWVMGALPRDPLLEVRATLCITLELERFQFRTVFVLVCSLWERLLLL